MSFASRVSLERLFREQVAKRAEAFSLRNWQQSHCTCTPSFLSNKLGHFPARKVCSKNRILATDIECAQILDVLAYELPIQHVLYPKLYKRN